MLKATPVLYTKNKIHHLYTIVAMQNWFDLVQIYTAVVYCHRYRYRNTEHKPTVPLKWAKSAMDDLYFYREALCGTHTVHWLHSTRQCVLWYCCYRLRACRFWRLLLLASSLFMLSSLTWQCGNGSEIYNWVNNREQHIVGMKILNFLFWFKISKFSTVQIV